MASTVVLPIRQATEHVQGTSETSGTLQEPDYWRDACDQLRKSDREAWERLQAFLPTPTRTASMIAADAARCIEDARRLRAEHHPRSEKVKKWFENTVGIIQKFAPLINSLAASNPYASIAWTAASAVLPIVLVPKQENEAALEGVQKIIELVYIYRAREASISPSKLRPEAFVLPEKVRDLYLQVLVYESALLRHQDKKAAKRIIDNIVNQGQWEKLNSELDRIDRDFTTVWQSELKDREDKAREEETAWRQEQRNRIAESKIQNTIKLFDTNYHEIKRSKERKGTRVNGTCEWFLRHPQYAQWLAQESSSILWVSAGPGSGKSVLSLFLFDAREQLLRSKATDDPIFCHYFFSTEFPSRNDAVTCLQALIHQILLHCPSASHAAEEQLRGRREEDAVKEFDTVWSILASLASSPEVSGRGIICIIDALDECQLKSREQLIEALAILFGPKSVSTQAKLKLVVTSRPYDDIEGAFVQYVRRLENVRLRGEEESKQIQAEIKKVIRFRINEMEERLGIKKKYRERLITKLSSSNDRTYLWLYLILDHIKRNFRRRSSNVDALVDEVPATVDDAYEKMLEGLNEDKQMERRARRLLQIVLVATRPLSPHEAWIALEAGEDLKRRSSGFLPAFDDGMDSTITSYCGLMLSVVDGKLLFLHQTAREFLLDKGEERKGKWQGSFTVAYAHAELARCCINLLYSKSGDLNGVIKALGPKESDDSDGSDDEASADDRSSRADSASEAGSSNSDAGLFGITKNLGLFGQYSWDNWTWHMREAGSAIDNRCVVNVHQALSVLENMAPEDSSRPEDSSESKRIVSWVLSHFVTYGYWDDGVTHWGLPVAVNAAALGLVEVLRELLLATVDDKTDATQRWTEPFLVGCSYTRLGVMTLLLDSGVDVNARWPSEASPSSHLLKLHHSEVRERDTALHMMIDVPYRTDGEDQMVDCMRLLLNRGADVNARGAKGNTLLHQISRFGSSSFREDLYEKATELLVAGGARLDISNDEGLTPMDCLEPPESKSKVQGVMIKHGASTAVSEAESLATLVAAIRLGYDDATKSILHSRPHLDVNCPDGRGRSPFFAAVAYGRSEIESMLLQRPDVDTSLSCDREGNSALAWACSNGSLDAVRRLVSDPRISLCARNIRGYSALTRLLYSIRDDAREMEGNSKLLVLLESLQNVGGLEDALDLETMQGAFTLLSPVLRRFLLRVYGEHRLSMGGRGQELFEALARSWWLDSWTFAYLLGMEGIDPAVQGENGDTVLHWVLSSKGSNLEDGFRCVESLIAKGYNRPAVRNKKGMTAWDNYIDYGWSRSFYRIEEKWWRLRSRTLLHQWMTECGEEPAEVDVCRVLACQASVGECECDCVSPAYHRWLRARNKMNERYWRDYRTKRKMKSCRACEWLIEDTTMEELSEGAAVEELTETSSHGGLARSRNSVQERDAGLLTENAGGTRLGSDNVIIESKTDQHAPMDETERRKRQSLSWILN